MHFLLAGYFVNSTTKNDDYWKKEGIQEYRKHSKELAIKTQLSSIAIANICLFDFKLLS